MATVQVTDNFAAENWSTAAGSPDRVTSSPQHGYETYALEISTSATNEYVYYSTFGGSPTRVMVGFWFLFGTMPSADAQIAKIDFGSCEARLIMQSSGVPYIKADGTPGMVSSVFSSSLATNTWCWVELMLDVSADPWVLRANLNGSTVTTSGTATATTAGSAFVLLGTNRADTMTCRYSYMNYGTAASSTDWFGQLSSGAPSSITFTDDFAAQNWTSSSGTPSRVSSPLHGYETKSLEINPSAASEYVYYAAFGGSPTRVVAGFWVRQPSFAADIKLAKIDTGTGEAWIKITSGGELYIVGEGTPSMSSALSGYNLTVDTWEWVEMMVDKSANPWEYRLRVNGSVASTTGAAAASNCGSDFVLLGTTATETYTAYYSYLNYGTATTDDSWLGEQSGPPVASGVSRMMLLGVG